MAFDCQADFAVGGSRQNRRAKAKGYLRRQSAIGIDGAEGNANRIDPQCSRIAQVNAIARLSRDACDLGAQGLSSDSGADTAVGGAEEQLTTDHLAAEVIRTRPQNGSVRTDHGNASAGLNTAESDVITCRQ